MRNFKITISKKAYDDKPVEKLIKMGKFVGSPWTLNEAKSTQDELVTTDIHQCAAVILAKAGEKAHVLHLHPDHKVNAWDKVKEHLIQIQESLRGKDSNIKLEGLLFGGMLKRNVGWPNVTPSRTSWQARQLCNFFRDTNVDFSAFLLQKEETISHLHYSFPNHEATIWIEGPKMFQRKLTQLQEIFSRIKISPSHQIIFRGED